MATPQRRDVHISHDGRTIAVEVRSAGGTRPAVVILGDGFPGLAERLARAGLMAVSCAGEDLEAALAGLERGDLGPPPSAIGLVGGATTRPSVRVLPQGETDPVRWFVRQLG